MYPERSFLLLSLAALTVFALRRLSPAIKHALWLVTLVMLLLLPLFALLPLPRALTTFAFAPEIFSGKSAAAAAASWSVVSWRVLWSCAAALLLLRLVAAHFVVRRFLAATTPAPIFARWVEGQRVVTHPSLRSPLTVGFFHATIVMPEVARDWPEPFLRAVFAHELEHVRRRDCATQLIAQVSRAIYWFNPLVWLAERSMRAERERACDQAALATGVKGSDYAQSLLALAGGSHLALAAAAVDGLERRIKDILAPKRHWSRGAAQATLVLFVALAAFIACGKRSPMSSDKTKTAPTSATISANALAELPQGKMDPDSIRKVIHHNSDAIKACYENELAKTPAIEGEITVHFYIMLEGTVSNVTTDSDMGSPATERCIAQKIASLTFPKPDSGYVNVAYPFRFSLHGP